VIRVASERLIEPSLYSRVFRVQPVARLMAERYYILQLGLSLVGTIWYGIIWCMGLLGCWTA
jgi:hypothetical protein